MTESKERRQFSRVIYLTSCHLVHEGKKHIGELLDISLKGALIRKKKSPFFKVGDACRFEFDISDGDITLCADAEVVYLEELRTGIQFLWIDIETMTHLRRLIELNMFESNGIRDELFFIRS